MSSRNSNNNILPVINEKSSVTTDFACKLKYRLNLPSPSPPAKLLLGKSPSERLQSDEFIEDPSNYCQDYKWHVSNPAPKKEVDDPENIPGFDIRLFSRYHHYVVDGAAAESSEDDDLKMLAVIENELANATVSSVAATSSFTAAATASTFHRPDVTWLRKTEYISPDLRGRKGRSDPNELIHRPSKYSMDELNEIIENQFFYSSNEEVKHPLNPPLKLISSFPVFPINFDCSSNEALVTIEDYSAKKRKISPNLILVQDSEDATKNTFQLYSSRKDEPSLYEAETETQFQYFPVETAQSVQLLLRLPKDEQSEEEQHQNAFLSNVENRVLLKRKTGRKIKSTTTDSSVNRKYPPFRLNTHSIDYS